MHQRGKLFWERAPYIHGTPFQLPIADKYLIRKPGSFQIPFCFQGMVNRRLQIGIVPLFIQLLKKDFFRRPGTPSRVGISNRSGSTAL